MNDRTTIMIALLAVVMMTAPIASALVTDFDVTANTTEAGVTAEYTMQLNTTGFNSLNITIPAGFGAVAPTAGGQLVARVDMWDGAELVNFTFTANITEPSTKVDVLAYDWSGPMGPFVKSVDYGAGNVTAMWEEDYMANLRLPNAIADGTMNMSVGGDGIMNMTVVLYLVKNPTTARTYTFVANETNSSAVTIGLPKDGNVDSIGGVDFNDALYLARHTIMPGSYPLYADGNVDSIGGVDFNDALYLARHTIMPGSYPLYP